MNKCGFFCLAILFCICGGLPLSAGAQPLKNFTAFSGEVVDESGNPMPGIQVQFMQSLDTFSSHSGKETNDKGSFTLQLRKDATGIVFANTPGRVVDYDFVHDPVHEVKLTLKSEGRKLAGTVVDSDGNPVPNALIAISGDVHKKFENVDRHFRLGLMYAGSRHLKADSFGHFTAIDLPDMPLIVWAAMSDDNKGMEKQITYSMKKPVVDLTDGDVLDYKAVIDPPVHLSPHLQEQSDSLMDFLKRKKEERKRHP